MLSCRLDIKRLAAELTDLENRRALWQRRRFGARVEAVELVETRILERIAAEETEQPRPDLSELRHRATSLVERLEEANGGLLRSLEERIAAGGCRGSELRKELVSCAGLLPDRGEAYDSLDLLITGLLSVDEPTQSPGDWDPEMVPYQPTPARLILEVIDRAEIGPDDVLIDVGSGLGQVPIVVSLLTGARSVGVEMEPDYCVCARRCAARLNLSEVQFVSADARDADFGEGTVFYLYTPFRGDMLCQVLGKLETEATSRRIRICTLGPCTETVSRQAWLHCQYRESRDLEFEMGVFVST